MRQEDSLLLLLLSCSQPQPALKFLGEENPLFMTFNFQSSQHKVFFRLPHFNLARSRNGLCGMDKILLYRLSTFNFLFTKSSFVGGTATWKDP